MSRTGTDGLNSADRNAVWRLCQCCSFDVEYIAHRYLDDLAPDTVKNVIRNIYRQICRNIKVITAQPYPEDWVVSATVGAARLKRRKLYFALYPERDRMAADSLDGSPLNIPSAFSPQERDLLRRYLERGDRVKDIAFDLNMDELQVRKCLEWARQRLRNALTDQFCSSTAPDRSAARDKVE